jgi:anti-sigma factor RsiW
MAQTMDCEHRNEKLDAYLDGELSADEARAMHEHLRSCSICAAESVARLQQKRLLQVAGQKFTPNPAFRSRIQKRMSSSSGARRYWLPVLAMAAVLVIAGASVLTIQRGRLEERQLLSQLVDTHVATLASANPVDVVSTDRHTVKPWFEGKIPFTFNLPELQNSEFTLLGGKVNYLNQSPGAELIFRVRQHQISTFIFQEAAIKGSPAGLRNALSFEVRSFSHNGLHYFVIGDASPQDLDRLSELLKSAG